MGLYDGLCGLLILWRVIGALLCERDRYSRSRR
jgi:hypothetical protein